MTRNRRAGAAIAVAATAVLLATGLATPAAQATGTPTSQATARQDAHGAIEAHKSAFRVGRDDRFAARGKAVLDRNGRAHVRYQRSYRGLPVSVATWSST